MTMKRSAIVVILLCSVLTFAQQNDGDKLVTVPQKYVSSEGMNHVDTESVAKVGQWVGIGKEVGIATKEGLNAVVDVTERFGATKVGTFVMVMIAWRIMGHEILGVLLGVPMLIAGLCVEFWLLRRFFLGYRVVTKREGKVKEYGDHPPYQFKGSDSRVGVACILALTAVAWSIMSVVAIFGGM